ncbi:biosynthetic peptidoglycan transglycosylase [Tabrizicola aquatica]|uniref:biosynthetic peptidoglycan transglycosylase n=1 Tax=Tabrizicola aquatica TaxID=909926 RepID=UPI0015E1897B|nr:biosynthetic peptidoglycan transglycosylase [Tabrizicola aquatica]
MADFDDNLADALTPEAVHMAYDAATAGRPTQPRLLGTAFVAAEDRFFFDEVPARSTLTATIAQWYPPDGSDRSIKRRLRKLQVGIALSDALSHDEILAWYMAGIYLGRNCFGVDAAAMAYFARPPEQLRLSEMAFLAALARTPTLFDSAQGPDKALQRRDFVLAEMAKAGFITEDEARQSANDPLAVTMPQQGCGT